MKKLTSGMGVLLLMLIATGMHAQSPAQSNTGTLIIYYTYDAYVEGTGEVHSNCEYFSFDKKAVSRELSFREGNGKDLWISTGNIWGFKFKGQLYRIFEKEKSPVCLVINGDLCYYETGSAYLDEDTATCGNFVYVSKDLRTPLYRLIKDQSSDKKEALRFSTDYAEFATFFACLDPKKYQAKMVRDCVNQYNSRNTKSTP